MTLSYSKPVKRRVRKPAKVQGGSRFEVHSAGFDQGNFSKIMINNVEIRTCDNEKGCRGLNVVAVDAFTHKVLLNRAYDTHETSGASDQFLADVKGFEAGTIFLVSVKDDAEHKLKDNLKAFFVKMGSSHVNALGFRHSWAFIGVKGQ
jgi:hypothetical protein